MRYFEKFRAKKPLKNSQELEPGKGFMLIFETKAYQKMDLKPYFIGTRDADLKEAYLHDYTNSEYRIYNSFKELVDSDISLKGMDRESAFVLELNLEPQQAIDKILQGEFHQTIIRATSFFDMLTIHKEPDKKIRMLTYEKSDFRLIPGP